MTASAWRVGIVLASWAWVGVGLAAQPAIPAEAGHGPVLSSTPTPPPGAESEPAQMSGMPLQVGDLPPGTVAVRVIRRSFADNVGNVGVDLTVDDGTAPRRSATDAAGRAVFQGLRVGSVVRARVLVDGETLESQSFQLPGHGGVRLVLVAGVGAAVPPPEVQTVASGASTPPAPGPPIPGAVVSVDPQPPAAGRGVPLSGTSIDAATIVSGILLASATGALWWLGRGRSGVSHPRALQRERLFDELVALEQAHAAGGSGHDYARRRQALVDSIARLDAPRG
ncbi:MAG: hypothetical protein AB7O32_05510 [Vicinamibacterales bacterium]